MSSYGAQDIKHGITMQWYAFHEMTAKDKVEL